MFTNFYEFSSYFLVYAFIGWVVEVVFHVVTIGKIINRGFLNGPLCPIYGCGMVVALAVLNPVMDNLLLLFLGGMFLTTSIELVGGWALDKLFHMRWWDYSDEPFNLDGYICVKYAFAWGFGVVFVMRLINPPIDKAIRTVSSLTLGKIFVILLCLILFADLIATIVTILKFNKQLAAIDLLGREIHKVSDAITEGIGGASVAGMQKIDEAKVQAALGKAELKDMAKEAHEEFRDFAKSTQEEFRDFTTNAQEELLARKDAIIKKLTAHKIFGYGRILNAFPDAKHHDHNETLEQLKNEAGVKKKQ